MNILELDSYNLADAVKFNDRLNPRIWGPDEHLHPEVRERLLTIAEDFREFLGVPDLDLQDITISGSNAAYTYTPNSDIDLHLVVRMPDDPVYRELFDAKKFQYNEQHDITIGGADVELYVQAADQPHISQGVYSIVNNKWIQVPRRVKSVIDDTSTKNKFETVGNQIEKAIASGSLKRMTRMAEKIKKMRQTGLEAHGEFGPENLAFKMLRTQGKIKELYDARNAAKDQEFSLREKAVKPQKITWGFKTPKVMEDVGMSWDGVSPTTKMFLSEDDPTDEEILQDFIEFCVKELKIEHRPVIKLRRDPQWPVVHKTFGRYINDRHLLEVAWGNRHIMDVLRTVAHELTHKHQHERDGTRMGATAGETGSPWENEANARAGILMRDYARLHPDYFAVGQAHGLHADEVSESTPVGFVMPGASADPVKTWKNQVRQLITQYREDPSRLGELAQERGPGSAEAIAYAYIRHPKAKIPLPPGADVKESASGYIPTKKQARDPRFSMALTQDIRPGQLGKEANKLKLKTDSQGHPQVANPNGLFEQLMMEYKKLKEKKLFALAEEDLNEVSMRPSTLKQFANSPEAEGIQAGFEAELIFRDTINDDDDSEMEPDYNADERCRSIQQIIDFFNNGEYGGLTPRQESRLQDGLDEQYFEWQDEQMYAAWRDEQDDKVRDVWLEEKPMSERIHAALVDGLDLSDEEADRIQAMGEKTAPKFNLSSEEQAYADENPDYKIYLEAVGIADDVLDEDVEQSIAKEDGYYDQALESFREGFYVDDDSGFFDDIGLRWMSDVANSYDLDWPYLTGASNGGSRDWENIADSLNQVVDMPVKVSSGYHSATRKPGLWIVEPDSSLSPDDREDYGLEIVSPPMPLKQALEQLQAVTDWANSDEGNAYTNDSTGLHMGVSIPYKEGRVDYLKLILFLGDEYVLQQYGREANVFTKAAMKDIKSRAGSEANATRVLELLKHNLIELAERELVKSTGEGKYTSAHKHGKYIEFRSAGGDWLAEDNAEPGKLENTMMRYAYAMYLAGRPDLERREYAKKLYKLVAGGADDSTMALFSQYAAGELTAEQLKKRWAEKTIGTEKKMNQRWQLFYTDGTPVPGQSYNGYTENEVKNRIWAKYGREALDSGKYELRNMSEEQQWEVYDVNTGKTLEIVKGRNKGEVADQVYDKYVDQGIGFNVRPYVDPATLTPRAKLAKRIAEPKEEPETDTVDNYRGKWEFFYVPTGRVLDAVDDASIMQARAVLADTQRRYDDLPADQIQMRKADAEQEPAVAQNFGDNPYAAYERNSDRIDAIRAGQNATDRVGSWSIYDVTLGREISRMTDVAWQQASDRANEFEQSTGHNMSVRGLQENIDVVSGTGAIARAIAGAKPPSPVPVRRKDPAVKLDIKNKPLDPYAQTYKKPVEEGYGQYTRINDPGIFPDGFLYLSNHAKHDRLPERGIDMDRVIDLCRQAGNQYPQKLRNLGDIQFVIKAPDDFGVGLVKYQTPDGHYRYLIKTAHNRLRYGPEEPVFRVDSLTETLPAKNLNQLYNIKKQLANPAFSTAEPAPAEKPVPARPAQPRVHTALADLQRQRAKLNKILDLKQELETLAARAGRTRYGITPGLAADIEDIYPEPKSEADMDAMLQGYEIQKKKLTDYIARQRKVFPKESVEEGEVVPFRRPQAQPLLPQDVLHLANEWFWANDDTNTLQAVTDQGYGQGAENLVKYIQAQLQSKGWTIDFDDEIDNIVLTNRSGQTVALPVSDAYDGTGWATGTLSENFEDGKGPGRPGDSQRHGIPKHATMAELEKASHAKGRKGQLARWQLNMRRGKAK